MNIIVTGIMGRYPYGGIAWDAVMYLLGLRQLGHRVWYLEDTGETNYDPVKNSLGGEPGYALRFIESCLKPFGLSDRWCYVDSSGNYHGKDRRDWLQVCAAADLFLDVSGGCWFWRDEYAAIPCSAFVDTDPAFTQIAIAQGIDWYVEFFRRFGTLFTFGRNIGTAACQVPTSGFTWEHTWQPVCMDEWRPPDSTPRDCFTTVMTWKIESFLDIGGNKDVEFLKVLELPAHTGVPIELAINGPQEFLRQHGWVCRDAFDVSLTLGQYRDYVQSSLGEFSVAKQTYVQTNSGWFSERTECYLASGRPAVVQDTGFSSHLPVGSGLIAFRTLEEAVAGLEQVVADYGRHAKAARELAEAHFSPGAVLVPLLEKATRTRSIRC